MQPQGATSANVFEVYINVIGVSFPKLDEVFRTKNIDINKVLTNNNLFFMFAISLISLSGHTGFSSTQSINNPITKATTTT
jgi:hypothetical protein